LNGSTAEETAMTTTTAKRTPGPWEWDGFALKPKNPDPARHAVHTILEGETRAWGFVDTDYQVVLREDEGNRALIAAAPELLEAAQRVYRELADGDLTVGAIEDLAEAIKLATGEAP
jgi:hypothetical protein